MGETVQTPDHNIAITASVGLAHGKGGQVTPRQLVANADIALFEAKNGGRACARELTPGMLQEMADRRQLASELPNAIQNRQIIAYYQPQIDARTGRVIGAEALARWDHPRLGVMAPAAFLDIATELGLVASVDRCVMRQAMLFAVSAAETGTPLQSISVNLSADRLMDPNLTDDIQVLWAGQGSRLAIELLETIDLDDVADGSLVSDNLRRLRDMGVQIEMDDFGSGRASITSLLSVQPDRVKIDRHLIQAATRDPIKRQVVSAILDMARALGIESLAEGAETMEDVAIIQGLGCQLFQGYAFSRPLPETEFAAYLREQNGYAFGDQADARAAI
ncbi:MAG: GGDEF domain-containing phosphodiesterase, partial [Pseudomonadota bacterium]